MAFFAQTTLDWCVIEYVDGVLISFYVEKVFPSHYVIRHDVSQTGEFTKYFKMPSKTLTYLIRIRIRKKRNFPLPVFFTTSWRLTFLVYSRNKVTKISELDCSHKLPSNNDCCLSWFSFLFPPFPLRSIMSKELKRWLSTKCFNSDCANCILNTWLYTLSKLIKNNKHLNCIVFCTICYLSQYKIQSYFFQGKILLADLWYMLLWTL